MIRVPIVSDPESYSREPSASTQQVEIIPSSSIDGKKTEKSVCVYTFADRFSMFSSSNVAWKRAKEIR